MCPPGKPQGFSRLKSNLRPDRYTQAKALRGTRSRESQGAPRDVTGVGASTVMKSTGCSLFIQQLFLRPHACYRRGLHTCSQTLLIPGFKNRSYKTTTQRGSSSHASREPPRSQRLCVYPTRDLHSFSYFHPTLLLMDAEVGWVRRSFDKNLI